MMQYRPDIDGLRAVAVVSVVIYHAFPSAMPGGFAGVDVFFVISGYLITGILLRSIASDTFSISDFYARRIRRIFPALVLVLATGFLIGWFVLPPREFMQLGKHILAGAGFVSNLVFWSEAGYFDTDAIEKPLLHLWSLGIEEQFYIVWPLIIWFVNRKRLSVFWTIIGLSSCSFLFNLVLTSSAPVSAFYSPLSRAWELGMGGLVACVAAQGLQIEKRKATALSILGLSMIVVTFFAIDSASNFPGWLAALPVLGTCLVIVAGMHAVPNHVLLARRIPCALGLISYPLYLWHWMLISFAWIVLDRPPLIFEMLTVVGVSLVLAILTYALIERPIRRGVYIAALSRRALVITLSSSLTGLAVIGGFTWANGGFATRYPEDVRALLTYDYDFLTDARVDECWLDDKVAPDAFKETCFPTSSSKPKILLWGDSHAARLYPGFAEVYAKHYAIGIAARDGCPPVVSVGYEICQKSNEHILARIAAEKPEIVMLFGVWPTHAAKAKGMLIPAMDATIAKLADAGIEHIVLVGPAPYWEDPLPKVMLKYRENEHVLPRLKSGLTDSAFEMDQEFKKHAWITRVSYISLIDILCDDKGCLTYVPNDKRQLTTWDYGHLTTPGAVFVSERMMFPNK
ncbi:acyltransferase family protein [Mesorhizobium sp. SB112]|uniref:acyltransferase family protein n=1 Tax=Mesorhizobium sp. SB112 TaxID=3151853 RepID=UPI0032647145